MKQLKKFKQLPQAKLDKLYQRVDYLNSRWEDESEYEDWNDYKKNFKSFLKTVAPKATFKTATPTKFTFVYEKMLYTIKVGKNDITCKVTKG